jgi:hypothetical protein
MRKKASRVIEGYMWNSFAKKKKAPMYHRGVFFHWGKKHWFVDDKDAIKVSKLPRIVKCIRWESDESGCWRYTL